MSNITIYDELISFSVELVDLLKEDWRKFKIFINKNKKYCLWIIVLFITMQFTDLLNLGAAWDRYCKTHDIHNPHIQTGGDGSPAAAAPDGAAAKAPKSGRSGAGPVFGSSNKILGMVSGMFVIISFILVVVGIISIPILVLIVLTYTIIKFLVKQLSNL